MIGGCSKCHRFHSFFCNLSFKLFPGNKTKSMLGDEFTKECRSLEKYLQLLLVHPVFSHDENLRKFLIDEEVLSDILTVEYFFHSMW